MPARTPIAPFSPRLLQKLVVKSLLLLSAGMLSASAHVQFDHPFAPTELWVKAPEKAYRDDICLDGSWQFQPIALPTNFKIGVDTVPDLTPPTADGWDKVPLKVPSPWNVNAFGDPGKGFEGTGPDFRAYPSYPQAWETIKMGWVKRKFDVPAAWKGRRILIHVTAAAGELQFQVNGRDAGKKFDVFFPFDLDVTDLVNYGGANEILVGVRKPELFDKNEKHGHRTWQGGSFWGQAVVGFWQDVELVAVPVVRVTDTYVQSLVDQDTLKADVTLHNDGDAPAQVTVDGVVHGWTNLAPKDGDDAPVPNWKLDDAIALSLPGAPVTVPPHGDATVTIEQKVGSAMKFWTPDEPNLYGLLVDVKNGASVVDTKYTRFGWRQIKFDGNKLTLNGQPFSLKGDSWHFLGIPQMSRRYPWAWFTALHEAHLNAVRLHAEPYPEFYLDVADEMGIMVLDETAIWASDGGPNLDSDDFWHDTLDHIQSLVMRDRSHPCVFGWSVCNEVKPIVQGVFQNPPGMYDKLLSYYQQWYAEVQKLDPTRQWVSADGDGDGGGILPTFMIHYGGPDDLKKAGDGIKPWGVGEATSAYYSTPKFLQEKENFPNTIYLSQEERMKAIATEAYWHLMLQRQNGGSYRSVFNLIWYGLEPLPLGLPDLTKAPTLDDGVFFPAFQENTPGVQPERLGPYCTTVNPGYDPSLPIYKPWPLFDAIKAASAEPPTDYPQGTMPDGKWQAGSTDIALSATPIKSLAIAAGAGSALQENLTKLGVPFDAMKTTGGTPDLLIVDGAVPPEAPAKTLVDAALSAGGTVLVWGADAGTLPQLNALLPASVELTDRKTGSLMVAHDDPVVQGINIEDLYFAELDPKNIIENGLGGPLVDKSTVLLTANKLDWAYWNGRAEFAKTAMALRYEREAKPSGAALVECKAGQGKLVMTNLPSDSPLFKAQLLDRRILANLGIPLKPALDVGGPFLTTGDMVRVLAVGRFETTGENAENNFVDPAKDGQAREGNQIKRKKWQVASADKTKSLNLRKGPLDGPGDNAALYLSFWLQSPKALDNLLLDPNLPKVDLKMQTVDGVEVWLNGKSILQSPVGSTGDVVAPALPLQNGWNHVLLRLAHEKGDDKFSAQLVSSQPDFLTDLKSAMQKP